MTHLREERSGLRLGKWAVIDDAIEEFAAAEKLHHDVRIARGGHNLLERNNVLVRQLPQDGDLGLESLEILLIRQRGVFNDLRAYTRRQLTSQH